MQSFPFAIILGLACWLALPAFADPDGSPDTKERPKRPPEVTADQEADVMKFLEEHHPELSGLLTHLKSTRPAEFQRAVRDLWYAHERLKQIKQRDGKRYELEVKAWAVESKIQLVVARLAMNDGEPLRNELRQLLRERADLRLQILISDRDTQTERMKKLQEQIDRLSADQSEMLEKQFTALTKSSENLKAKSKRIASKQPARTPAAGNPQGRPKPGKAAPK